MTTRPDPATMLDNPSVVENADVTVVGGAGHVGIPLVLAFAEFGLTVNINDISETALASLRAGQTSLHRTWRGAFADQGARRQQIGVHFKPRQNQQPRAGDRHHRHAGR